jgi:hypothetical protein
VTAITTSVDAYTRGDVARFGLGASPEPRRVRVAGIPVRCRRLIVSVCDPQSILAELA